jgi:hypothetical protein
MIGINGDAVADDKHNHGLLNNTMALLKPRKHCAVHIPYQVLFCRRVQVMLVAGKIDFIKMRTKS